MPVARPVILSGGSGTRLWPLSTVRRPKQFAALLETGTLFEATLERVAGLPGAVAPTVVAGADHAEMVLAGFSKLGRSPGLLILEPEARNTAPAIAAAALLANPSDILVILPADHLIVDNEGFRGRLLDAVGLAGDGHIVTFGVFPTRADTGYGYVEVGDHVGAGMRLERFKEKPDPAAAESMAFDGNHLWNSGMFVVRAGLVVEEMERVCPQVIDPVRRSLVGASGEMFRLGPDFSLAERISFDHAVMERTGLGVVVPIDVGWSDIGSFLALYEATPKDGEGNATSGRVILDEVSDSFVMATTRVVAVAGLSDVVVVETEEGVLVLPLERSQHVRDLAQKSRRFEG